jgi:hypothetical protein
MRADELMEAAVETWRARNAVYGNSYIIHGDIAQALFPNGVVLKTPKDHARFANLTLIIGKLNRYCQNFSSGGHQDSIHDLGVYSFMQEELDCDSI